MHIGGDNKDLSGNNLRVYAGKSPLCRNRLSDRSGGYNAPIA